MSGSISISRGRYLHPCVITLRCLLLVFVIGTWMPTAAGAEDTRDDPFGKKYRVGTWQEYKANINFDQLSLEHRLVARIMYPLAYGKAFAMNHPVWALLILTILGG